MGDTNTSSAAGGTAGRRWPPNRRPRGANRLGAPPTSNANPPRSSSVASLPTALTVTSYNPPVTGSADETASAEAGQGRSRSGERRGAVPLARVDATKATPLPSDQPRHRTLVTHSSREGGSVRSPATGRPSAACGQVAIVVGARQSRSNLARGSRAVGLSADLGPCEAGDSGTRSDERSRLPILRLAQ